MKNSIYFFMICIFMLSCNNSTDSNSQVVELVEKEQSKDSEGNSTTPNNSTTNIDEQIKAIKQEFKRIEEGIEDFLVIKKSEEEEEEMEPTDFKAYYEEGNKLVKLTAEFALGHGAEETDYYYKDGELFFVYQKQYSEASIQGPFTFLEHRTYFHKGKVIRVLKKEFSTKDTGEVDLTKVPNKDITNELESLEKWGQLLIEESNNRVKLNK